MEIKLRWSFDKTLTTWESGLFAFMICLINIPKEKLPEIAKVMVWTDEDYSDFTAGIGGWDLTSQQVKAIEKILDKNFFQEDLDFQISGGEL